MQSFSSKTNSYSGTQTKTMKNMGKAGKKPGYNMLILATKI